MSTMIVVTFIEALQKLLFYVYVGHISGYIIFYLLFASFQIHNHVVEHATFPLEHSQDLEHLLLGSYGSYTL